MNEDAPSKRFTWSLSAHNDGFARLKVDESPSPGRYQIADVAEAGALGRTQDWVRLGEQAGGSSWGFGRMAVSISYKPFRMAFSVDGQPVVEFNSRDMFQFEHRRTKEVRASLTAARHADFPMIEALDEAVCCGG
jgi:alpha 1,3-glucosidase